MPAISLSIINPGAEIGDTTGWTNELGSLDLRTSSPDPHSGSYYFTGGYNAETKSYQDLDLIEAGVLGTDIDSGITQFFADWWQNSASALDQAEIFCKFLDSDKNLISTYNIGLGSTIPATYWGYRKLYTQIPPNTRHVRLYQHMYRVSGSWNDGYIDDIAAQVNINHHSLVITNNAANTGSTTGWTDELGSLGVNNTTINPYTLSHFFDGGSNAETKSYQELDLSTIEIENSDIDNNRCGIRLDWMQANIDDSAEIGVRFREDDSSHSLISSHFPGLTIRAPNYWQPETFTVDIPPYTRFIDVVMHMYRNIGTTNDGYIDNIFATVIVGSRPVAKSIPIIGQNLTTDVFSETNGQNLMFLGTII